MEDKYQPLYKYISFIYLYTYIMSGISMSTTLRESLASNHVSNHVSRPVPHTPFEQDRIINNLANKFEKCMTRHSIVSGKQQYKMCRKYLDQINIIRNNADILLEKK